jgi:hypothetical protein
MHGANANIVDKNLKSSRQFYSTSDWVRIIKNARCRKDGCFLGLIYNLLHSFMGLEEEFVVEAISPSQNPTVISKTTPIENSSLKITTKAGLNIPLRAGKQTHVFLTHNWSKDELGRDNHARVARVNKLLQAAGFIVWFDEERMMGSVRKLMSEGIDNTLAMIIFITRDYVSKVNGDDDRDNCRYEFTYGVEKLGPQNMVPVVMESRMRDNKTWTGEFGAALRTKLYVDMVEDDEVVLSAKMKELVFQICNRPNMTI